MEDKKDINGFFKHEGKLDEKFDAVLRHQESKGFSLKIGDIDYWGTIEHREMAQDGKYKGVGLYKIFNAGRDQYLRDKSVSKSGCILCLEARHIEDRGIILDKEWEAKANIYPILKGNHGILIHKEHIEQKLERSTILSVLKWAYEADGYRFFYNGRYAGASVNDHLHIQFFRTFEPFGLIGEKSPIEMFVQDKNNLELIEERKSIKVYSVLGYPVKDRPIKVIFAKGNPDDLNLMADELDAMLKDLEKNNLDYNVLWRKEKGLINTIIFPRSNKGFGVRADIENRIIKTDKDYLLDKNREINKRTRSRGFATIEFSGIFVAVDQKQYNSTTYDDFVEVLNQLGVAG
jgi:hypothetical protein